VAPEEGEMVLHRLPVKRSPVPIERIMSKGVSALSTSSVPSPARLLSSLVYPAAIPSDRLALLEDPVGPLVPPALKTVKLCNEVLIVTGGFCRRMQHAEAR
jgi:hypothetical protein